MARINDDYNRAWELVNDIMEYHGRYVEGFHYESTDDIDLDDYLAIAQGLNHFMTAIGMAIDHMK